MKQPPKHFLNHSILTNNMETSIANTQFIISIKWRKSFVCINIKRMWLNKEKLAKNTSKYQNLIIFNWDFIFFKKRKILWNCRDERPRYRYWAVSHARGLQVAWGQIDTSEDIQINRPWKKFGHNKQEMLFEEKYLLG